MKLNALKLATLAAILPLTAQAGVTVAPMATYAGYSNIAKDAFVPQLNLGYRFNNLPLAVDLVVGGTETDLVRSKHNRFTDQRFNGVEANLPSSNIVEYRLDGKYFLPLSDSKIEPYLAAGIGQIMFDGAEAGSLAQYANKGKGDYITYNAGGGLLFGLTDKLSAVADARYLTWAMGDGYSEDGRSVDDYRASLGLQYDFGGAAPVVPVPVVEAPTPEVVVDERVDSDGDGVYDDMDKCPGTPSNFRVDASGCPIEIVKPVSIPLRVLFDTNKAVVKPAYQGEIGKVVSFMNQFPNSTAVIEGHTDSRGSASYNQKLSQRRADSVKRAISAQGINPARLKAMGYGEAKPVASNATAEGRQQNRRVVAVVSGKQTVTQTR